MTAHRMRFAPLVALLLAFSARGQGIEHQMDAMFGSMSNVTNPQAHMGARRGVITGGGISLRNRAVNDRLMSFDPPRLQASCSGIDAYMGAFSYISKEQIVSTMRAIPSAAASYAFSLALAAVSPTIEEIVNKWQEKLQSQNWNMVDSCQLAQSLVDNTVGPSISAWANESNRQLRVQQGLSTDTFDASNQGDAESGVARTQRERPDVVYPMLVAGNLIWDALNQSNAASWFSGGSDRLLEDIMTVTGTVVVCLPGRDECPEPRGGQQFATQEGAPIVYTWPARFRLADLVYGHRGFDADGDSVDLQGYRCGDSKCLRVEQRGAQFEGLLPKLEVLLLAEPGGLLPRYAVNAGADFNAQEKSVFEAMGPLGPMLLQLARQDAGFARAMAREYLPTIATMIVYELLTQVLDAAEYALSVNGNDPSGAGREVIEASRLRLRADRDAAQQTASQFAGMVMAYRTARDFQTRTGRRALSPMASSGTAN